MLVTPGDIGDVGDPAMVGVLVPFLVARISNDGQQGFVFFY